VSDMDDKYKRHDTCEVIHSLKIRIEHYTDIVNGGKRCEIRKNDRDFRVDDVLYLMEWDAGSDGYGKWSEMFRVTHITDFPDGLKDGYIAMSIVPLDVREAE